MSATAPSSASTIAATALDTGQRVQFAETGDLWWTVRAVSDDQNFVLLTAQSRRKTTTTTSPTTQKTASTTRSSTTNAEYADRTTCGATATTPTNKSPDRGHWWRIR